MNIIIIIIINYMYSSYLSYKYIIKTNKQIVLAEYKAFNEFVAKLEIQKYKIQNVKNTDIH